MYTRQKTCTINKTERYLYLSGLVNSRGGPLSGLVNLLYPIRDASQFRLALILPCCTKQKKKKNRQTNKQTFTAQYRIYTSIFAEYGSSHIVEGELNRIHAVCRGH